MTSINHFRVKHLLLNFFFFFIINFDFYKIMYLSKVTDWGVFFLKKNISENNNLKFKNMISNDSILYKPIDNVFNFVDKFFFLKKFKSQDSKNNLISYNFVFFNYAIKNSFKLHHDWNLFFANDLLNNAIIINLRMFIKKWKTSQNFIFNIFFYDLSPLLFGSSDFFLEISSINWHYFKFENKIWKYLNTLFMFKNNNYSVKTKHFYTKISEYGIDFLFVTNVNYHWKNIFYFNYFKFFTIGPVNINISPWILSYSIPVFNNYLMVEQFFIKFLIYFEKQALLVKYDLIKSTWSYHFTKNKLSLLK